MYTCECGRQFEKANSLNAHYCYCQIHRKGKPAKDKLKGTRGWCKGKTYEEYLGTKRAKEYKKTISSSLINWHNNNEVSLETRDKLSKKAKEYLENHKHISWYEVYNGKKNIKVQGIWEKTVAEWLNKQHILWTRETIRYDIVRRYTPDFYLPELNCYIEVKGWMRDSDIIKMNKVINEHNICIKMIYKPDYKNLHNLTINDLKEYAQIDK